MVTTYHDFYIKTRPSTSPGTLVPIQTVAMMQEDLSVVPSVKSVDLLSGIPAGATLVPPAVQIVEKMQEDLSVPSVKSADLLSGIPATRKGMDLCNSLSNINAWISERSDDAFEMQTFLKYAEKSVKKDSNLLESGANAEVGKFTHLVNLKSEKLKDIFDELVEANRVRVF
jgi:hypothetical protein